MNPNSEKEECKGKPSQSAPSGAARRAKSEPQQRKRRTQRNAFAEHAVQSRTARNKMTPAREHQREHQRSSGSTSGSTSGGAQAEAQAETQVEAQAEAQVGAQAGAQVGAPAQCDPQQRRRITQRNTFAECAIQSRTARQQEEIGAK